LTMCEQLSSYAVTEGVSRGRVFAEERHPYRSDFERDRDRIIHCSAFRRLEGKTQVFSPGLDDYYRSRLTHSIEVSQIGRTIAAALGLNEGLTEAICLAHDLGHSPFGHAGEAALNELMRGFGGFEHNRQALRIVELLEHPYPDFVGLNLMYETRLGLARHRGPYDQPGEDGFGEANCSLEGQAANVADRIAYNCHDVEDGMRARVLGEGRLREVRIFAEAWERVGAGAIEDRTIRRTRTAKAIINRLVGDCIEASKKKLAGAGIETPAEVLGEGEDMVVLSAESGAEVAELEGFLMRNFYEHESLAATAAKVRDSLGRLFERLCGRCELMPRYFERFVAEHGLERTVCDYIAGMTDRFCRKMSEQIQPEPPAHYAI